MAVWGTAALLLLLPLVAMQFTDEVDWTLSDFIVMGAMLSAACGAYELATRMTGNRAYRAAVGVAVVAAFLLVWVNLAVGIIGSENNSANLLFAGVLAVGLVGALLARFQPRGMARAMVATAIAQALVAVVVPLAGWDLKAVPLTAFFSAAWLVAAWLFGKAARGISASVATS
jgi:hypothetical protein